jgi:hypothetical protein
MWETIVSNWGLGQVTLRERRLKLWLWLDQPLLLLSLLRRLIQSWRLRLAELVGRGLDKKSLDRRPQQILLVIPNFELEPFHFIRTCPKCC